MCRWLAPVADALGAAAAAAAHARAWDGAHGMAEPDENVDGNALRGAAPNSGACAGSGKGLAGAGKPDGQAEPRLDSALDAVHSHPLAKALAAVAAAAPDPKPDTRVPCACAGAPEALALAAAGAAASAWAACESNRCLGALLLVRAASLPGPTP